MAHFILKNISMAQQSRLESIDFLLEFFGKVSRQWLSEYWKMGSANCTRDLALYKQLAPTNLILRHQNKTYYRTDEFQPVFTHDVQAALAKLNQCLDKNLTEELSNENTDIIKGNDALILPDKTILATVCRAVSLGNTINISYQGLSEKCNLIEIAPHTIFLGFLGWYVRAYDKSLGKFSDFFLCQIDGISELNQGFDRVELISKDEQWNNLVELILEPHPSVNNAKAIELIYKMKKGVLKIRGNAVMAKHYLRRENVDCNLKSSEGKFLLHLKNKREVDFAFKT
ncbi:hypothetical protein [Paraglaciecola arctica]|uniref:WYL domain-containing protein n=1 Tax=Paraglaciecola arctica BSs20135 TaxID=493475 RepID=K6YS21_9ALTE|nr:hypothetical protein [Paraglaciecola arctica]GAC19478.1 hypothetical protein GARC_2512 [Paraglaciecola arctica BSs20135]